jgi:ABC-type nitrate/sulfonate/bicarbonate transport system permease component
VLTVGGGVRRRRSPGRRPSGDADRIGRARAAAAGAKLRGLAPLALGLAIWQVIGSPTSPYLPPPSAWYEEGRSLAVNGILGPALLSTVTSLLVGLALAVSVGVAFGAFVGFSPRASRTLTPTLEFLRAVPPPTMVPIALLMLGIGSATTFSVVVLAAVWPVLLNTRAAAAEIHPVLGESSRVLGLPWHARAWKVFLPAMLPGVMLGVRVAAPLVFIVTLLVEMLTANGGLGTLIITGQRNYVPAEVFAVLVVIGVLGLVLNASFVAVEMAVLRHRRPAARRSE